MASKTNYLRGVNEWISLVKDTSSIFYNKLNDIYGDNDSSKAEATEMCLRILNAFAQKYGIDRNVIMLHSTGRINLVGTHVDHRGGSVNPIAIKQMWLLVEPRDDDQVLIKNVETDRFPDEQFRISSCLPAGSKIENWDAWCHDEFEKRRGNPSITWSNYIRALTLYFQHLNTTDDGTFALPVKGMNMMFYGNIPVATGLSSSSALVTIAAEAVMRINGIKIKPMEIIEHCGYAEWYVGTRGGCGDHAAIILGQLNKILHMTAFPMTVESLTFPQGYKIVLANSLVEAKKQAGARNTFNNRVAAYVFGLMMIKKNFPQYANKIQHLRDVNPSWLGIDEAMIYQIVKSLPISAGRAEILELLPEHSEEIHHTFRSHDEPEEGYKIRQICLYGIAECIRADMVPQCLRTGDMKTFGRLISKSHDGDRVTKLVDEKRIPVDKNYSDSKIDGLIADLKSAEPCRADKARLWQQPGGYNVSVIEMDELVDIALAAPGVIGAGLVGAGMGGSIVAVVENKYAEQLVEKMAKEYYHPHNLPVEAEIIAPVGGLCTIDI